MKNYHSHVTANSPTFPSIELSDTLAENISGGMTVTASASSDSGDATSSGMATSMTGSGLSFLANDSIAQDKSFALSAYSLPTTSPDLVVQDVAVCRFNFRTLEFKNHKLRSTFEKFRFHHYV